MKIDLMGNIVKIDTLSLDEDLEISNGTIVLTGAESEAAIDAKKLHNTTIINNTIVFKNHTPKWKFIKCCLRMAWEEAFKKESEEK